MRIAGTGGNAAMAPIAAGTLPEGAAAIESTFAAAPVVNAAPLQSAALEPARAALRAMPDSDIDMEMVGRLRDQLARGQLPFDAAKLAGLIQRFHTGRGQS
jgi:negative regulator of flagellin synthesis FlgM